MTANSNKAKRKTVRRKTEYTEDERKYIDTEGGDPKFRKKVVDLHRKGHDIIVLEPGVFDHGIKRVGWKRDGYAAVYDYDKLIEALAEDYKRSNKDDPKYTIEEARTDAIDWIQYNTLRSLPYMMGYGGAVPKLVYTSETGREKRL